MIDTLLNVKNDIKSAIERRGITPEGGMTTYADSIDKIQINNNNNGVVLYHVTESDHSYDGSARLKLGHSIFLENPKILLINGGDLCSYYFPDAGVFSGCKHLKYVQLFDTSNATNMYKMFSDCSSLVTVPLFDTSKVTSMSYMFSGCGSLVTVPLFDTSSLKNMSYMFQNCTSLQSVPEFDTSNVTDMRYMFSGCGSLQSVPEFDTSNVYSDDYGSYLAGLFQGCSSLRSVPCVFYDTHNDYMFDGCTLLEETPNFTNPVEGQYMFRNCKSLYRAPSIHSTSVTGYFCRGMFQGCISLRTVPFLSGAMGDEYMFDGCVNLEDIEEVVDFIPNDNDYYNWSGCKKLTRGSVLNIFNNMIAAPDDDYGEFYFEPEVIARLTDEDIAIATNKNCRVKSY